MRANTIIRAFAGSVLLALACACAAPAARKAGAEEQKLERTLSVIEGEEREYRIAPQDLLAISVYREEDLKKEARVSADGKISFPLAGEVAVGGMTTLEAEAKVKEALKGQLVNPQVSVEVKEYRTRRVFVLGEVAKPGSIEIPPDRELSVVEAITLAGGLTKYASPNSTRVVRKGSNGLQKMVVPVASVTAGDKSKDVALRSGDVVYVPETMF
jgi:protein involved in polysaccharide export with SLBB domain